MNHDDLLFAAKVAASGLPHQGHADYDKLLRAQAEAELLRREIRETAEDDFYTFCSAVIGNDILYEPLHRPYCEHLEDPELALGLLPRGTLKSTIGTVYYSLWILVRYPDSTILIGSEKLKQPRKWVREMKGIITEHPVFRWVFPETCPDDEEKQQWGYAEHFTVRNRSPDTPWGESSVEICSITTPPVGGRAHVILLDDVVGEENSKTTNGLEAAEQFYRACRPLLHREHETQSEKRWDVVTPHIHVTGTRYAYDDLYGKMLERGTKTMVRKAIEDGKLVYPTSLTQAKLDEERREMGSAAYSAQYMLDPVDPESALFKREDVTYFTEQDLERRRLSIALTIDIAHKPKAHSDESAVVVTGVDDG